MTEIEQKAFEVLRRFFPKFDDGYFHVMKQTQHPYWDEAVEMEKQELNWG